MALTAKERMALWRQRKRADSESYEKYKQAKRERYKSKKERGIVRSVSDMSDRDRRNTRRRWKKNSKTYRERKGMISNLITPPNSPEGNPPVAENPARSNKRSASMKKVHKKKMKASSSKCYRENKKLKVKLNFQIRLKEKYKKRAQRLKRKLETQNNEISKEEMKENFTIRKFRLYKAMEISIRERYNATKSYTEKRMIASLILSYRLLKKYGIGTVAESVLGISRRHLTPKKPRPFSSNKLKLKQDVEDFLERDDNSSLKADKQATITRNGVKKQIRLLRDDMKNLHVKFEAENRKISYSLFCRLRPFWTCRPTEKDRHTCLCKIHDNLRMKLKVGVSNGMYETEDVNILARKLVCNEDNKNCMYRDCTVCSNKILEYNDGGNEGKQLTWSMWKNKRIEKTDNKESKQKVSSMTVKENEFGTKAILADEINKEMNRACRHIFNIRQQYKTLKLLKDKMSHEEIIIHIDFSENYCCKYSDEVQSVHFGASKRQISLHTGVVYFDKDLLSFTSVSDNLKHGPAAIWAHLDPVLTFVTSRKKFSTIHFISDGPTTQYRSKYNFYLWSTRIYQYGFTKSTWNFLEASHGKGAADGVGAAIKRLADKQVLVKKQDITCAKDFLKTLSSEESKIMLFPVYEGLIDKLETDIPDEIKSVPATMKIHQLILQRPGQFSVRDVSCFCSHPVVCDCFKPMSTSFAVKEKQIPAGLDRESDTPDKCTSSTEKAQDTVLEKVFVVDETLLGRHCVVQYDGLPYPGIVLDVDENDIEVKTMHKIGLNRFFWPMIEDRLWYSKENIITLLQTAPQPVTKRHHQIDPAVWKVIAEQLDL